MTTQSGPAPANGEEVAVPKAAQLVASALRRQIIRGTIGDGDAIPSESELMSQFGVSRPTLREALRVLEWENLITVRRGARGGATAHQIREDLVSRYAILLLESRGTTLSDVYQAQVTFEPACVRDLALARTRRQLQVLRETLAAEATADQAESDARARVGFHYTLIELTGNQTILLLARMVSDILLAASGGVHIGVGRTAAMRDHARVIDLIEQKNAEAAHDLWRDHLELARRRVLSEVGGDRQVLDIVP